MILSSAMPLFGEIFAHAFGGHVGFSTTLASRQKNTKQLEIAVLGFDVVRGGAGVFGANHERRGFGRLGCRVSVIFHAPVNFRTDCLSCREEIASRFLGVLKRCPSP